MKKHLCHFLSLMILVTSFAGCGKKPAETLPGSSDAPTPSIEATTAPEETTVPPATEDPLLEELRNNLPRMDGSTSMIPLEAGIRAALFGKSIEEATADVFHTTSWGAFHNLLSDQVDLIFSVPLSADQETLAVESNVLLEAVPIAKEGFVFVVNAENPVDKLTQQQIRDIYSGKITNWSQVGGLDEDIIPYQRNRDSGSQNYMLAFMGSTPLMDAPTDLRPASMSGLMDVIAVNDNSRAAIGYSVYAYAADMYGNGNEIKFIRVDGVAPSKQTFANGTYPLMGYNYAVFRSNEPADSPVRKLVDWMLTPEGQYSIARAGYVTLTDIGYDYEEQIINRYSGFGTGIPPAEPDVDEYILCETTIEYYDNGQNTWENEITYPFLIPKIEVHSDGRQYFRIDQLADYALEREINAWLDEQLVWASENEDDVQALVDRLNQGYDYERYSLIGYSELPASASIGSAHCIATAKNGILSVAVTQRYFENIMESKPLCYHTETASWDLLTGMRLRVEDLFCRGVDIDETLNAYLRTRSQAASDYYGDVVDMKADFASLPLDGWHITHDTIYFDHDNPYFSFGEEFSLEYLPDGTLVTEQSRDFSSALDSNDAFSRRQFRISDRDLIYRYTRDQFTSFCLLNEDRYPEAAQVNQYVTYILNTYYTEEAIFSYFSDLGLDPNQVDAFWIDWYLENWGGRYLYYRGSSPSYYDGSSFIYYPFESWVLYDLQNQRHISWQDLLMPGWENAVVWDQNLLPSNPEYAHLEWFRLENGNCLQVCISENGNHYYMSIPAEYILY